jgi:hypothetical protein
MAAISVNAGPGVTTVHDALITPGMLGQGSAPAGAIGPAPVVVSGPANDMTFASASDAVTIADMIGGASLGGSHGWGGDIVGVSSDGAVGGGPAWGGTNYGTAASAVGGGAMTFADPGGIGSSVLDAGIASAAIGMGEPSGGVVGGGPGASSVDVAGVIGGGSVGGATTGGWSIEGAGSATLDQSAAPANVGGGPVPAATDLSALTGLLGTATTMAMALGGLTSARDDRTGDAANG